MLLLAKRIVSIVTNHGESRLKELQEHVLNKKDPQRIIIHSISYYSFIKIYHPKFQTENNNITFMKIYNLNHKINLKIFYSCRGKIKNKELTICIQKKKYDYPLDNLQAYVTF